jgi:hypothetical protein
MKILKVVSARPHPQERENNSPSLSKACGWSCRASFREMISAQLLSPLNGGEGQSEGHRFH